MPDYSKGKIYGLYYKSILFYVGSTCQSLTNRKYHHHSNFKKNITPDKWFYYQYGKKNPVDNWNLVDIHLIEEYPCTCQSELRLKEREYFLYYENIYNQYLPISIDEDKQTYITRAKRFEEWERKSLDKYYSKQRRGMKWNYQVMIHELVDDQKLSKNTQEP